MSLRIVAGVLSSSVALPPAQIVTLVEETFTQSFGLFATPGADQPGRAWTRRSSGGTPTGSTGPAGGSSPTTRAVQSSNGYIHVEASDGPVAANSDVYTIEGPELDSSVGLLTLTFDVHMRFGTNGDQTDGTLEVQGWEGAAWSTISNAITGSQQTSDTAPYLPSTDFGTYDSTSFSNTDFKFRLKFTEGSTLIAGGTFNYDCAVDNLKITGPSSLVPNPSPPALGFDTGLRRVFVSKSGNDGNSGLSSGSPKLTIQGALNIAQPGDVITVGDGTYREKPSLSNFAGTVSLPLWIVAENRGGAIISNLWTEADEGTVTWNLDSDDVYFASRSARPYIGSEGIDFLMHYKTEADLRASTITAFSAISGGNETISKPDYGFAFVQGENRVYLRLKDRSNPNGKSIKLTANFASTIFDFNNADNVILDGFVIEGAGNASAVNFDSSCANPTVRNCSFTHTRHAVRVVSNTIIEWCSYSYTGLGTWARDLFALDGFDDQGVFVLFKGYYNAEDIPESGGGFFNALLEGSIDFNRDAGSAAVNVDMRFNLIGPCFDGSRIGECNFSFLRNSVIVECFDDAYQNEGTSTHPATGNHVNDNLIKNCYRSGSHQDDTIVGDAFTYRNVIVQDDPDVALFGAILKMISTPNACDVFVYHNTIIVDYPSPIGKSVRIWDDFSSATAEEIERFYNNIVILNGENLNGAQSSERPTIIERNAVVGTSSGNVSVLTEGSGVFAGTSTAAMALNSDFSLQASSPARGIGRSLASGNPDSRSGSGANDDAGAFPFGEAPGPNWPRPDTITFDTGLPSRWTSPG